MTVDLMRLISAKHKINRAFEHVNELKFLLEEFDKSEFPGFVLVNNEAGNTFIATKFPDLPVKVSIVCGEFAYQARSALDIAFVQTALNNGSTASRLHFPFAKKEAILLDSKTPQGSSLAEVPVAVRKAVLSFKPYDEPGGDKLLVSLNHICNNDKHRDLLSITASFGSRMSFEPPDGGSERDGLLAAGLMGQLMAQADTFSMFGHMGDLEILVNTDRSTPEELVEVANRYLKISPHVKINNKDFSLDCDLIEACHKILSRVCDVIDAIEQAS